MKRLLRSGIRPGRIPANVGAMLLERRRAMGARRVYCEIRNGSQRCLTWEDLHLRVARLGGALVKLGLRKGDVAALYSRNREEMMLFELAVMSVGAIACPIFSEYPAASLDYVLAHCGARFLAVSDEKHLGTVLQTKAFKRLVGVFVMDAFRPVGHPVASFDKLYCVCREGGCTCHAVFERRRKTVRPSDPCLLMYTSGTTGRPKGVLLSHRNILSQQGAIEKLWNLKPGGRVLSYLPWHHSFGGIFELFGALYSGACITLDDSYGKDLGRLVENFKRVKPTIYFSVPRIHQALVDESRRSKKAEREIFHPGLRFVFTAAAALPRHVADRYAQKGIPVVEGWGLTETSPCVTMTGFDHARRPGAVGLPLPGVTVKISAEGEILVKGPNVMLGYFKDRPRTARAFTRDGWFRTGDFGEIHDYGLVLKCRKDGMFKLNNGEMVISQRVENALAADPLIQHAVVVGSGRDYVGVLVFPNPRALSEAAKKRGIRSSSLEGMLRNKKIRTLLGEAVKNASLAVGEKYARPRAVFIASGEPSLENGELTPTMKVVKSKVLENHAGAVEALFSDGKGVIRL